MQNGATGFWLRSRSNCAEGIESGKINREKKNRKPPSFGVRSTPVKCRRCSPFVFTTDYSPGDLATMLQSGGVQLLDVQTLMALRELMNQLFGGD